MIGKPPRDCWMDWKVSTLQFLSISSVRVWLPSDLKDDKTVKESGKRIEIAMH